MALVSWGMHLLMSAEGIGKLLSQAILPLLSRIRQYFLFMMIWPLELTSHLNFCWHTLHSNFWFSISRHDSHRVHPQNSLSGTLLSLLNGYLQTIQSRSKWRITWLIELHSLEGLSKKKGTNSSSCWLTFWPQSMTWVVSSLSSLLSFDKMFFLAIWSESELLEDKCYDFFSMTF